MFILLISMCRYLRQMRKGTGVCISLKKKKCSLYSSHHPSLYPSLLQTWLSLLMIWMAVREYEASWHSLLEEGICALLA